MNNASDPAMTKQTKRFVAASMSRALQLVRDEMGPEAVILSSQRTAKGVEIITSLEPDLPTRGIDVRRQFGQNFDSEYDRAMRSDQAWKTQAGMQQAVAGYAGKVERNGLAGLSPQAQRGEELDKEIELARERMFEAKRRVSETQVSPQRNPTNPTTELLTPQERQQQNQYNPTQSRLHVQVGDANEGVFDDDADIGDKQKLALLQSEIADMRMLLEQQLWQRQPRPTMDAPLSSLHGQTPQHNKGLDPAKAQLLNQHLSQLGLLEDSRQWLLSQVQNAARVSEAWRDCMAHLSRTLPVMDYDLVQGGGVFALVGPTGVGKTTTLAKLAARYLLDKGPGTVAVVTTDTFRVGAQEQLRSLSRILGVPIKVVTPQQSLLITLNELKSFSLVLIDTAGFRLGDPMLKEQMAMLDQCPSVSRLLVLAGNSQAQTLQACFHAYGQNVAPTACILSKVDECSRLGESLSVLLGQKVPLAYITDGQDIPKDIALANGPRLVAKAVALMRESRDGEALAV